MAKYLRKKKKNPAGRIVLLVVVLLLLAAFVIFLMPRLLYSLRGDGGEESLPQTEPQISAEPTASAEMAEPVQTAPAAAFPLALEDGKLEISSLFQFTGINPDCGNQEGTNIGAITLKNVSDSYLEEAHITLTLVDGSQLHFAVTELPAGASAMVFSTENTGIPENAACAGAVSDASFDDSAVTVSDRVAAYADGIHITVTNTSDEDISRIVVYCRSPLGEEYFGGITYSYTITDLPAGESTSVDATDCILGIAEVVRFAIN